MNRMNRKVEYALMALKYMSTKYAGQLSTAKEICQATHAPFDATSRVMQLMAQRGILKAEHGAHGGYLIVRDLQRVTFFEVLESVLGPTEVVRCVNSNGDCELLQNCNVVSPLQEFNSRLSAFYKSLPVSELFGKKDLSTRDFRPEAAI